MTKAKAPSPVQCSTARKSKREASSGLGPLDSDAARLVLQDQHDLSIIRRLKSDLEELEHGLMTFEQPSRDNVLKILKAIHRAVSGLTTRSGGATRAFEPFEQTVAIEHSAKSADLLASIMGQLVDLDHGRVGDLFRPAGGGGNPFTYEENAIRNLALIAMQAIRQPNGLEKRKTLPMVYDEVAKALKEAGIQHHGQEIDAKLLRSWWTYKPKKRYQNAALSFDED